MDDVKVFKGWAKNALPRFPVNEQEFLACENARKASLSLRLVKKRDVSPQDRDCVAMALYQRGVIRQDSLTLSGEGQAPEWQHRRALGRPEAPANSTGGHGCGNGHAPEPGPAAAATVVPDTSVWLWGQSPSCPRHCPLPQKRAPATLVLTAGRSQQKGTR